MPSAKQATNVIPLHGRTEPVATPREALRALMEEHGEAIHAYCFRIVRNQTLAADILQQVFEQAYRDLASLREPRQARAWLFGIAHHRCLDALKAQRRLAKRVANEPDILNERADEQPEVGERVDTARLVKALDVCIRELSAESRTAVLLRFQEEMSYEHMATICREKPATLQARVARALPVLRRCLKGKGLAQ